jgi:hypothetical protein
MFIRGTVLLGCVRRPADMPIIGDIFIVELRDEEGNEHHTTSKRQPKVWDRDGKPMTLAAELGSGSKVVVMTAELSVKPFRHILRAVQVIEHVAVNPFPPV